MEETKTISKVPPRENGFLMSLDGALERAAERMAKTRDHKHLSWSLRLLLEHLTELHKDPTEANLREFLSFWRVD